MKSQGPEESPENYGAMDKLSKEEADLIKSKYKKAKKKTPPLKSSDVKKELKDRREPIKKELDLVQLGVSTKGTAICVDERKYQLEKGYTPQHDFENNNPGTLIEAAKGIVEYDIHKRIDAKPKGWNQDLWNKYCIKPERERLAIASAWLMGELDRYYYFENLSNGKK